ncbi:HD-GYP domain-containing protein [Limnochorda pilosa]|uniref:Phosphohydrolase n=1 Tax=Limnochorda pilosa TaxID=1555112 RepID=A0A0K2SPB4_LIMPI|nr:HD-GYP domain-containing protein [Limnochorda pilosa]BAS28644.1 phosphohydrolase [Limnochorda pilosa]
MRLLLLKDVRPGMVLGRPVYAEGRTLVAPGVVLTPHVLDRLAQFGIQTLYVRDPGDAALTASAAAEAAEVVSERVRREAYHSVKQYMERMRKGLAATLADTKRVTQAVVSVLEEVLANRNVVLELADIRAMQDYVFNHSVGVGVTASLLGIHQGLERKDLLPLAVGALLHDVGKVKIADAVWNKPGKLTDEEYRLMQQHTVHGFEILRKNPGFDLRSAHVAYQHHERWNGSGYPRGLAGEKIHLFARIVAVVDVFDAMTTDRAYRPARPVYQVLALMEAESGKTFDPDVIRTFLARVAPYPVGTLVRLNTGERALVVQLNEGVPARPVVRLVGHDLEIDLRVNLAQRIVGPAEDVPDREGPGAPA